MKLLKCTLLIGIQATMLSYSVDCFTAASLDAESMQCCATMPCAPANHSDGCCKTTTFAKMPNMLPGARVLLHAPAAAAVEYARTVEIAQSAPGSLVTVGPQQHSPPELYTLHVSLLI